MRRRRQTESDSERRARGPQPPVRKSRPRIGDKAARTRERLLQIAEQEFARLGYRGAHLQGIAEQIGMQKTALYYYFPSKSALYTSVLTNMLEAFESTLNGPKRGASPVEQRFEHLVDTLNRLLAERPHYARILVRMFIDDTGVDYPAVEPIIRRLVGRVILLYREGVESGRLQRHSSRHLFLSLFGSALFYYAAPYFSGAVLEVSDVFDDEIVSWRAHAMRRLLLEGILPRPPRGIEPG